ncbi:hypothetical protein [Castellaniella sp.]|uniref:hypothetical protein n=1 Tax=Castellaniella sp. TaxID=1955812 RepID=UPI00356B1ABA
MVKAGIHSASYGKPCRGMRLQGKGVRQGLADVLMVLLWAAMVPATLWLGVAAGF